MSDFIRILNEEGTQQYREYIAQLRDRKTGVPPRHLLFDPATSQEFEPNITITPQSFGSRFELGSYLADLLSPAEPRVISRNVGLWNWLSLYFFDQLCPANASDIRKLLSPPHYVLDRQFAHRRYYRHLVRFAWLSYLVHGDQSRVLLSQPEKPEPGVGQWGELSEQLGAYQWVFGNPTIIAAAARLYLSQNGVPLRNITTRKGAVRRLPTIANRLWLTYDLRTCPLSRFIRLLPPEFDRWRRDYLRHAPRPDTAPDQPRPA